MSTLTSFPPLFGVRRSLRCPPLERYDFAALDGRALCIHHTSGGDRGPVVITPGTAMTALSYCIDTVPTNFVEYLVEEGYDVWLFDWRTSPLLASHELPYSLDDVARYDWPAAISEVRRRTSAQRVSVVSHCLSAPCFLFSLLRGYVDHDVIKAFVASQVALHFRMTMVHQLKLRTRVDRLLPGKDMIHQKPSKVSAQISDFAISLLSLILPRSFSCDNPACYRHSSTFGEVVEHTRLNAPTHALMGELIPECLTAFLKDVAVHARTESALEEDDFNHLNRLNLPIHFLAGSMNRMFVPAATELSYLTLCEANGPENYRRTVFRGFGHLDCFLSEAARNEIWPEILNTLDRAG
ncbi:MAG: hypothetical protein JO170_27650 [Verrucomicrobia bacterium]|nr:hypothetical protein [Verrucomicrobiota bacterium]